VTITILPGVLVLRTTQRQWLPGNRW